MDKALKPIIIILLVLCVGSLVLGIQLFGKREILKGRVQENEQALAKVASNIGHAGFNVSALAAEDADGLARMKAPLNSLAVAAQLQYTELQDSKQDLETARQDLNMTKDELDRTLSDLDRTKVQLETATTRLNEKTAEAAALEGRVDSLEQEKVTLSIQVDDLNNTILQTEDELRDTRDKILTLEQTINLMDIELGQGRTRAIPKGLTGRILQVNKDWNFVVIDLGANDGLVPNAEMLIHRKDVLIGKVIISGVTPVMSIAELNIDWAQTSVKEGDFVVF
jgi:myosin heavy subunit